MHGVIEAQHEIVASAGADLSHVMNVVVQRTQQLSGASAAAVELRDGDEMVYRAASGSAASALGLRLKLHGSLSGLCVRERSTLICHDTESDARVDREACRRIGIRSMLVVPLRSRGEVVGVLKVMAPDTARFDRQTAECLDLMAGLIGEALAQARAREEAASAAALFESAFTHATIGMALVSLEGRFTRANDSLCQLLGYGRDELLSLRFHQLTHPDDLAQDDGHLQRMLRGEAETYEREKRYLHKQGGTVWVHLTSALVRDAAGAPSYLVAQVQDVTGRKLAESESQAFFELSPDLLAIAGPDGCFEAVNGAWTRALGHSQAELTERPWLDFVHPDDQANTRVRRGDGASDQKFRNRYRRSDGGYRWLEWSAKPSPHGRYYCIARDVTEQVEREAQLSQLASLDALTGLPNRRYFDLSIARMGAENARADRPLALFLLDLDHFKAINDEHGHAAGDAVLQRFAKVLLSCVREGDAVARWGGEEFAMLVSGVQTRDLLSLAERIRRTCFETEMVPGAPSWRVSVSIGVAERVAASEPSTFWLSRADAALYEAKRSGRNRVCVSD